MLVLSESAACFFPFFPFSFFCISHYLVPWDRGGNRPGWVYVAGSKTPLVQKHVIRSGGKHTDDTHSCRAIPPINMINYWCDKTDPVIKERLKVSVFCLFSGAFHVFRVHRKWAEREREGNIQQRASGKNRSTDIMSHATSNPRDTRGPTVCLMLTNCCSLFRGMQEIELWKWENGTEGLCNIFLPGENQFPVVSKCWTTVKILVTGATSCLPDTESGPILVFEIQGPRMRVAERERKMYFKYSSFMSVLKESGGVCRAQGKGIRWCGAPHLHRALQVTTARGGGVCRPPHAKVFNLVKPEGLSRCLIIKGVWTKGYSKPAGATNWTFSSVLDGWLPSEIVCFSPLCLCWITRDFQRPALSALPVKEQASSTCEAFFIDAATFCVYYKIKLEVNVCLCSTLESLVYDASLMHVRIKLWRKTQKRQLG